MWRDLDDACRAAGIPYRRPSLFPRSGLLAARIACANDDAPWLGAFVRNVFRANFAEDRDIADPGTIRTCLTRARVAPDALIEAAGHGDVKARLRERTSDAERRGIFGAPAFLVRDTLYWGNERLPQALTAAAGGINRREA